MSNLSVRVVSDDETLVAHLNWLIEFMALTDWEGAAGTLTFSDDDHPLSGGRRSALIRIGEDPCPEAVAHLPWPPTVAAFERAVHAGLSRLKEQDTGSADAPLKFGELVGISDSILAARHLMAKVATNDATVLITGESGTGKEVVARALHEHSRRASGAFVPVNCGAIPAELLESELFGHEKGAFTGAVSAKPGRFELASGGTLFLDEVGDMPLSMQVKVLRALQDKAYERVGGVETRHADVRILAATHQDLVAMIEQGTFREDLYYRLNVFPIELSPLRDRTEDLPLLIQAIAARIEAEQGLKVRLTLDAIAVLAAYPWPGNVRELRNLLERLSIQFPNELVSTSDLPAKYLGGGESLAVRPVLVADQTGSAQADRLSDPEAVARLPVNGLDLKDYLGRLERSLIEQALEDTNSVVARAADRLHIRRTTLVEKMRKYGIERV